MVSVLIKKKSRLLCSYLMMMNNGTPTKRHAGSGRFEAFISMEVLKPDVLKPDILKSDFLL